MGNIKDVRLGNIQVDKIYSGADLVFEKTPIDTTAPITSIRPYDAVNNPTNTYTEPQTIYLDVNEMCRHLLYFGWWNTNHCICKIYWWWNPD